MKKPKIHVLFEYGVNLRPHASSSLRLLRPLSHPLITDHVDVTFGYDLWEDNPDLIFVDRLWRPDIKPEDIYKLSEGVHKSGAQLIYWFDDHFLLIEGQKKLSKTVEDSFRAFLDVSDGFVVSTLALKQAHLQLKNLHYLPSALDERLIIRKPWPKARSQKFTIGYMGSFTHDNDLSIIIPAFEALNGVYPNKINFELLGIISQETMRNWQELSHLHIRIIDPLSYPSEYQAFMVWFTSAIHWDMGIAPLADTVFNSYKSDIKFLDYAASAIPGVFSKVPAYEGTVEHRNSGLIVKNNADAWIAALTEMYESDELRQEISKKSASYLFQQRILSVCAMNWVDLIKAIV